METSERTTTAQGAAGHAVAADEALAIVEGLVSELGTTPGRGGVRLGDALDRDLGLGSLERVELHLRLERAFGVRLPDAVVSEAETVADLVAAIAGAAPSVPERPPARIAAPQVGQASPSTALTLPEVLRWHAEAAPERAHIFLHSDDGGEAAITYGELWRRASAVAAGLRHHGVAPGESVAIMLRTEEAFFSVFFGILIAGAVPVPIYPPFRLDRLEEYAARQVRILENAGARLLVTFPEAARLARLLRPRVPALAGVVTTDRIAEPGAAAPVVAGDPEARALIQYTSGSTGEPKGVVLTHANILANIRALGQVVAVRPDDVFVSWLPLYHDMGLIGAWLGSLHFAVPVVILSPVAFLARPARWLRALHAHRGTLSAAPNFAFDLCVRRIAPKGIEGLDLSAWRLAWNGSEPVSPRTIERFTRRFAPYGFRGEAMCPVYGLAESSVGLTLTRPGRGPRIDRIRREPFTRWRRAEPASPGEPGALEFVSCGEPLPDHEVRVVEAGGAPVGERLEGRIQFRGPSVTAGYFRNPEATRAAWQDGWMDSGDLGYWAEGELHVTGRRKDVIIKAGRNLYPQEVEDLVGDLPGIRKGCVAVFGVPDPEVGTERLVVVVESRETAPEAREQLRATVLDRVVTALGIPPDTVVVAAPGAVLKTSSGKIRRSATREAYVRGTLGRRAPATIQWTRLRATDLALRLRSALGGVRALGFAAWVGGILALTLPVLAARVTLLREGAAVDRAVRRWCRTVLTLTGCPVAVEGVERLPGRGPMMVVANHASYVDAVALLGAIPVELRFLVKKELLSTPLVGRVIRKVGHLTVDRLDLSQSRADAERVTAALRQGLAVLVFPEGTFDRAPGLLPFKLGAFKAAVDARCPVVPVVISGTRHILPAYAWLPRRGPIGVRIGAPIVPASGEWREIVRLRDLVRAEIARNIVEPATGAP